MLTTSFVLSALAAVASAQSFNVTFVEGLMAHLQGLGLNKLVAAANSSINSTGTQYLLQNINGTSKTLLAPTDAAFTGLAANATTNATLLGDRLAYHLLAGSFPGSAFSTAPNHTIARTYLTDPEFVHLEGNKSQVLALNIDGGATRVLNQNTVVTITNTSSYQNLLIQIVDAVIDTPGTLTAAFDTWKLTAAPAALQQLNYTPALLAAHGITVFAPNDAAFANAASTLSAQNSTTVASIIGNHIINGTSVYSPLLGSGSYTSTAGSKFTFANNGSGLFVTSGNTTAKVVQSDIIIQNGVMHIIDTVLFNNQSNPSAASSAFAGYTSTAGQGSQQTGAVGANPTETGPVGSTNTSKSSASRIETGGSSALQFVALVAGTLAGAALLV